MLSGENSMMKHSGMCEEVAPRDIREQDMRTYLMSLGGQELNLIQWDTDAKRDAAEEAVAKLEQEFRDLVSAPISNNIEKGSLFYFLIEIDISDQRCSRPLSVTAAVRGWIVCQRQADQGS